MNNTYELLMSLPIFNGASHDRLLQIVETTKLDFLKFQEGEQIISTGNQCTDLKLIISGDVRVSITTNDGQISVSQCLSAPNIIAPEYIFGRTTKYPCDAHAISAVGILQISKSDYLKILKSDEIFLINFLNIISSNAQKSIEGAIAMTELNTEKRIALIVSSLTQQGGTDITIAGLNNNLTSIFGDNADSSAKETLKAMKSKGLIDYNSSEIKIVDRRAIIDIIRN